MDGAPGDPFLELIDDARLDRAVRERQHQRLRRHRSADLATLIGTARDLAERHHRVTVLTVTGRRHQARLAGVGPDHLSLRSEHRGTLHVALDAVAALSAEPGPARPAAGGDRPPAHDRRLAEVLAELVGARPEVLVVVRGADEAFGGRLTGVGEDVVTVTGSRVAYLHLPAVTELAVIP